MDCAKYVKWNHICIVINVTKTPNHTLVTEFGLIVRSMCIAFSHIILGFFLFTFASAIKLKNSSIIEIDVPTPLDNWQPPSTKLTDFLKQNRRLNC